VEVLLIAFGASMLLAFGAGKLSDGMRHRAVGAIAGAAFGVFGVAGLFGALLLIVVPAYRRATYRRDREGAPTALARGSMRTRERGRPDRPEEEP